MNILQLFFRYDTEFESDYFFDCYTSLPILELLLEHNDKTHIISTFVHDTASNITYYTLASENFILAKRLWDVGKLKYEDDIDYIMPYIERIKRKINEDFGLLRLASNEELLYFTYKYTHPYYLLNNKYEYRELDEKHKTIKEPLSAEELRRINREHLQMLYELGYSDDYY